jgi:hypothetical protein
MRNIVIILAVFVYAGAASAQEQFVRLLPLPAPKIVSAAQAYFDGKYPATSLLDGNVKTEFASNNASTNTFVEFEFNAPATIGAFRFVDRDDPATVAECELAFFDDSGRQSAKLIVPLKNRRAGVTFYALPEPVTARRVRWRVTELGNGLGTVGGAEISFWMVGESESAPRHIAIHAATKSIITRKGDQPSESQFRRFRFPAPL